jgi:hypothetical protein
VANLAVPSPRTFTVGEIEAGAYFNATRDALTYLLNVPLCVITQGVSQSFANGTPAAITYDAQQLDTYGGHSNSVNNSRYTAQVSGWYYCKAGVVFAANATGNRTIQLYKNGTAYTYSWNAGLAAGTFNDPGIETSALIQLSVGDYVEAWATQNSGGALSSAVVSTIASNMQCMWMHT